MTDDIKHQERIDRYILGQMEPMERLEFEADIRDDEALRLEYEAQAEIARSVERVNMRKVIQQITEDRKRHPLRNIVEKVFGADIWGGTVALRVGYSFAALASVAIICVTSFHFAAVSTIRGFGDQYYAQLIDPATSRSDDFKAEQLSKAYELIGQGKLDEALAIVDSDEMLRSEHSFLEMTEENEYLQALDNKYIQTAQWYKAIIYMKQGKTKKAKRILKDILAEDSEYSLQASEILDSLK